MMLRSLWEALAPNPPTYLGFPKQMNPRHHAPITPGTGSLGCCVGSLLKEHGPSTVGSHFRVLHLCPPRRTRRVINGDETPREALAPSPLPPCFPPTPPPITPGTGSLGCCVGSLLKEHGPSTVGSHFRVLHLCPPRRTRRVINGDETPREALAPSPLPPCFPPTPPPITPGTGSLGCCVGSLLKEHGPSAVGSHFRILHRCPPRRTRRAINDAEIPREALAPKPPPTLVSPNK